MKVMMLAPGGSVHSARPLAWLLERGCEVLFVDDVRPRPRGDGAFTHAPNPLAAGRRRWLGWRLSHRLAYARLRQLYRRFRPDIVHVHWVDQRALACADCGLRPLILTVWGSDINRLFESGIDASYRRRIGETLSAADLVIVDSADMPAKCEELANGPVSTALLPLGIDTAKFRPVSAETRSQWRRRMGIEGDATVFMSVRAWGPRYGHDQILEAFALARQRTPRTMALVFKVYNTKDYPEASALEVALRRRVEELGLERDIRWLTEVSVDELPALYGAADVIVNYPSMDAFPVTFIESAACQCPVISIDLPAYRGTFVHDYFAIVPADDVEALAAAIQMHAERDGAEARLKLAPARDLMIREFDEATTAARLLAHYAQVAQTGWSADR